MQRIRQKKHGSIRDFYAAAILTGCLTIFLCLLWVIHPDLIFGSTMDWNNQHIIFPDYFRSRFYQTGQLFPNFASAIGAGQNIYEFTYYGLFNPIFLLSYLLPFVPMMDYIQCSSILLIWGSGMLCYWFCRQHFSERIVFRSADLSWPSAFDVHELSAVFILGIVCRSAVSDASPCFDFADSGEYLYLRVQLLFCSWQFPDDFFVCMVSLFAGIRLEKILFAADSGALVFCRNALYVLFAPDCPRPLAGTFRNALG